jgi:hypothetical protein
LSLLVLPGLGGRVVRGVREARGRAATGCKLRRGRFQGRGASQLRPSTYSVTHSAAEERHTSGSACAASCHPGRELIAGAWPSGGGPNLSLMGQLPAAGAGRSGQLAAGRREGFAFGRRAGPQRAVTCRSVATVAIDHFAHPSGIFEAETASTDGRTCSSPAPLAAEHQAAPPRHDAPEPSTAPAAGTTDDSEEFWLQRTRLLLGEEGLRQLRDTRLLVVGLGGVGSWACEFLARAVRLSSARKHQHAYYHGVDYAQCRAWAGPPALWRCGVPCHVFPRSRRAWAT